MGTADGSSDVRKPKILVVDDNHCDYELLREASQEVGFDVHYDHVSEGLAVLPFLERLIGDGSGGPDLILLDINLPVMNGHDILQALKDDARFDDIPVVMFSSSPRTEDRDLAIRNGAAGFLVKPASFEEYFPLLSIIENLIASHGELDRSASAAADVRPLRGMPAMRNLSRILVVHEDPSVANLLREALISHRFTALVELARTEENALFHLGQHHDERTRWLVMLCLGLHHQGGLGLLRRLRSSSRYQDIPVIILSQHHRREDERQALAIGADFYFEMPDTIDRYDTVVRCCRELLAVHDDEDGEQDDRSGAG